MKRFLIKTFLLALPVLLIIIIVNYYGDAANLFKPELERRMARIISNDSNVTNITNFNERIFRKEISLHRTSPPEILVLGSSRAMLIGSDFFPQKDILNASVSGAVMEDIIAIYQLYKERNILPKKIIIGVDPWLFNKNISEDRWKALARHYYTFFNRNQVNFSNYWRKYSQIISLSYFQSSVRNIPRRIDDVSGPMATTKLLNETHTWLEDGSLVYPEKYRNSTIEQVESKIDSYKTGGIYRIGNSETISKKKLSHFKMLLEDMEKNDIEIELFLAPYPPSVFDKIEKEYPMVLYSEKRIKSLAESKNIKVYGSYNPYRMEVDIEDFYDGMHANEKGIQKILNYHNKS